MDYTTYMIYVNLHHLHNITTCSGFLCQVALLHFQHLKCIAVVVCYCSFNSRSNSRILHACAWCATISYASCQSQMNVLLCRHFEKALFRWIKQSLDIAIQSQHMKIQNFELATGAILFVLWADLCHNGNCWCVWGMFSPCISNVWCGGFGA